MKPKLLRALVLGFLAGMLVMFLIGLIPFKNGRYWRRIAYEAEAALSAAQNKTLRYARELRAIERKERIVAIGKDLQSEPDTLDSLGGE